MVFLERLVRRTLRSVINVSGEIAGAVLVLMVLAGAMWLAVWLYRTRHARKNRRSEVRAQALCERDSMLERLAWCADEARQAEREVQLATYSAWGSSLAEELAALSTEFDHWHREALKYKLLYAGESVGNHLWLAEYNRRARHFQRASYLFGKAKRAHQQIDIAIAEAAQLAESRYNALLGYRLKKAEVAQELRVAEVYYATMAATYALVVWESVASNIDDAKKRMADARQLIRGQYDNLHLEDMPQKYQTALAIQAARRLLDEARGLLRSVMDVNQALEDLEREAMRSVTALQADLRLIARHTRTVLSVLPANPSCERELRQAKANLAEAKQKLRELTPDHQAILELVLAADHLIGRSWGWVGTTLQCEDRLMRRARTALVRAQVQVLKVRRFISDHHAHISEATESRLELVVSRLRQAENDLTPGAIFVNATRALTGARELYASACQDVRLAKEEI